MVKTGVRRTGDPLKSMKGRPLLPSNCLAELVHAAFMDDPYLVDGRYILLANLVERLDRSAVPIYLALRDGKIPSKLARSVCALSEGRIKMADVVDYLT